MQQLLISFQSYGFNSHLIRISSHQRFVVVVPFSILPAIPSANPSRRQMTCWHHRSCSFTFLFACIRIKIVISLSSFVFTNQTHHHFFSLVKFAQSFRKRRLFLVHFHKGVSFPHLLILHYDASE